MREGVGGQGNDPGFLNSDASFTPVAALKRCLLERVGWIDPPLVRPISLPQTYGYRTRQRLRAVRPRFITPAITQAPTVWQMRKRLSVGLEALYASWKPATAWTAATTGRIHIGMGVFAFCMRIHEHPTEVIQFLKAKVPLFGRLHRRATLVTSSVALEWLHSRRTSHRPSRERKHALGVVLSRHRDGLSSRGRCAQHLGRWNRRGHSERWRPE